MAARTVILAGARTPFGRLGGALAPVTAPRLGGAAIRAALDRANLPDADVDHAIMGLVVAAGVGQVPSRQATVAAGLPVTLTSETVNKVCSSGMRAVSLADQIIRAGDARVVVAGGMESMSNAPYLIRRARFGYRMGHGELVDAMVADGLTDPFHDVHMGVHNSDVAAEYRISREDQDAWALRSHRRAIAAAERGIMAEEIVPVEVPGRRGGLQIVDQDEGPRRDTSLEALAALKPVFKPDGTTTAGNAPGVSDGAAALVVAAPAYAADRGLPPLAEIVGWGSVAVEPRLFPLVAAAAARETLSRLGIAPREVDLWEINEAFAAVAVNSIRLLDIDPERVNVNGGAVALGHPIGASGARIVLTLALELRRRGGGLGVATICSGTAQGDTLVIDVPRR